MQLSFSKILIQQYNKIFRMPSSSKESLQKLITGKINPEFKLDFSLKSCKKMIILMNQLTQSDRLNCGTTQKQWENMFSDQQQNPKKVTLMEDSNNLMKSWIFYLKILFHKNLKVGKKQSAEQWMSSHKAITRTSLQLIQQKISELRNIL